MTFIPALRATSMRLAVRASKASLSAAKPSTMAAWKSMTRSAEVLGSTERLSVMARPTLYYETSVKGAIHRVSR